MLTVPSRYGTARNQMVFPCLALCWEDAVATRIACRAVPRLVATEPQGAKEAYGGDQGRLRVDLRLSSADADDVGAEYSLHTCSRYSRSGSVKDGRACPHRRL